MKDSIANSLSKQFNNELYSSYLYLSMSAYCNAEGFVGFANWFYVQVQEELAHATHMYQHILDRGAIPVLEDVKASPVSYKNMQDVFEQTLRHEQFVTGEINRISSLALQESDHATYQFLQWYVNEQVEEESTAELLLQKVKHIGDNSALLLMLDNELAARTFTDPFAGSANA